MAVRCTTCQVIFLTWRAILQDREIVSVSAIGGVFGKDKQRLAGIEDPGIDTAEIQAMIAGGHCLTVNINWGMPEGYA